MSSVTSTSGQAALSRFFAKIPHLGYSLTSSIYNMFVQVSAMIGANSKAFTLRFLCWNNLTR